jgi:hypothetical protein
MRRSRGPRQCPRAVGPDPLRRDEARPVVLSEVVDPFRPPDHQHVAVGDFPAAFSSASSIKRVLVEHDAEAVPGHVANRESGVSPRRVCRNQFACAGGHSWRVPPQDRFRQRLSQQISHPNERFRRGRRSARAVIKRLNPSFEAGPPTTAHRYPPRPSASWTTMCRLKHKQYIQTIVVRAVLAPWSSTSSCSRSFRSYASTPVCCVASCGRHMRKAR